MRPVHSYLRGAARPLTDLYDVALLDLDGVVYLGPEPIPGVPEALRSARAAGMRLAFVTNNAARPPHAVADHLTELGIAARPDEVVTSAQAAARYLADRLPGGARVLVVGTVGLEQALRERGLRPVTDALGQVDAVVQGYSPDMNWHLLAEGAIAINRGVPWIATNLDPTVPSPRGRLPGNGSLVAALRHATGKEPVATGKPDPAMHRESLLRTEAQRPLVVGDRLDTDIEGASAVGCPSLLVFSGVTDPAELLAAAPKQRPTYLAADVGGLLVPHPEVELSDSGAVCGGWRAETGEAANPRRLALRATAGAQDHLDALRALCAALWATADGAPGPVEVVAEGDDPAASRAIDRLGLG
jgi:HAD superfamily hydrolase (TIGR01450 family)